MFKNLRDKLQSVSQKVEDELEAQLEAQLEQELAESVGSGGGAQEPAGTSEPASSGGEEAVGRSEDEPQSAAAQAGPEPAAGEPEPTRVEKPPAADGAAPAGPAVKQAPESAVEETASETAAEGEQEPPEQPQERQPQKITGRRQLSEEEIQERLARELESAVETQREVEETVKGSGVAKFSINEEVLDDILWELEIGLLESDVALPVIEAIKENVREQLLSLTVGGGNPNEIVEKVLRTAIRRVLNVSPIDFDAFVKEKLESGKRPVVVMFVGVNGTGKTTSIARIAHRLKENGTSCVLAAGDTFRAGAIEQLTQHADKLGVKIVKHSAGADPAAVAYDAIEHAKARHKEVVLLDTAGRMQTNVNLMDEMDKIRRVAKPDLVVFVGDSLAGNDAVEQARQFDEVVDVDGAILTKVDVDAKGGAALSVAYTINKPLIFVGVGQDYPDLRPFDAGWMVDRLFGEDAEAVAEAAA